MTNSALRDMVEWQIRARGVRNATVLEAMLRVDRARFVPEELRHAAYDDYPLPIGEGQTISQPYIVALMTELLLPQAGHRVLEVGTGSGYQTAVLAEIVAEVHSVEIVEPLGRRSAELLQSLGYGNVHVHLADGHRGWPEAAPYDGIIVTAAPRTVPPALVEQLRVGGRLVIPVGSGLEQQLRVIQRRAEGPPRVFDEIPVRFVPMTGGEEWGSRGSEE